MTKKKPSPQNRIWEKERRERLNKTFDDLQRLLPDHEPASALSKVEILQRAIELISKLQKKIKVLIEECNDPLKEHVKEQEHRLQRLLVRNEELAGLLRKAKINVPPCKYTIAEEDIQRQNEEKENGNRDKKPVAKQRRTGTTPKKSPVIDKQPPASVASSESLELSVVKCIPSTVSGVNSALSSCSSCSILATTGPPALRHSNGIGPGNGVNVTPALHPTPIMTTSVIISNNGNLVQVPIVAPPSSLLIVGNEDVRSKINLKNRPTDASPARYRGKRGKFTIKSIDLIPGRIVNGKIPIPPLRRNTSDSLKAASKAPRLKRKRLIEKCKRMRKSSTSTSTTTRQNKTHDSKLAKRPRLHEIGKTYNEGNTKSDGDTHQKQNEHVLEPAVSKIPPKEQQKNTHTNLNEPARETHLDISLNQTELPEDIFANLHVGPDGSNVHGNGNEDGTLSPTAAYLMNFPIVAGGGKAAGNHADTGEGEECQHDSAPVEHQPSKSNITATNEQTNGMIMDNFSSYFNYGHIDTMGVGGAPTLGHDVSTLHSIPTLAASVSTAVTTTSHSIPATGSTTKENNFTNFPTIYQSIDNMLDNRPVATNRSTAVGSTNRSLSTDTDFPGSVTFTFTLTSNTCTAPTTAQPTIGSAHFYGSSCGALNPVKAVDEFSSPLKPSIEFTFSLTSTTASQPRTVQSQYTNSSMLATTMTTPSYETYGYFHKNVSKASNYCSSFNVLDPLLATEKPATSFTFSLTSSTKTEPAYAQSTIVTVSSTNTTQTYGTPPKLSTKQYHQPTVDSFPPKQTPAPKADKVSQRANKGNSSHSAHANGMQQQQQQPNQSQQQSASKYDVSWMAAGVHNGQSTVSSHSNQHQQTQHSSYEPASLIEFPTTVGYSTTNNYKSDIFFAHPPGEEHNLTWSSPSKLSNILNDSSSPYFPPVTLPTLNGDLALNTSGGVNSFGGGISAGTSNKPTSCKVATNHTKKSYTHSSSVGTVHNDAPSSGSFLSVSQLVNEPSKSYPGNTNSNVIAMSGSSSSGVCQQKPANNNYSAEALIGNSYTTHSSYSSVGLENGRKDKPFEYGTNTLDNVPNTAGPLILNFDSFANSSGMDYNKGYNFGNQQNGYITSSYGDAAYSGSSNCGIASNAATSSSIPYYGKASVAQGYYNQSNTEGTMLETGSSSTAANYPSASHPQSIGQDYAPYYLPAFGEKKQYPTPTHGGSSDQSGTKIKKSHKSTAVVPAVDYVCHATVTSTTMASTTMSSSTSNYSYTSLSNVSNNALIASAGSLDHGTSQMDVSSYSNYHHHHRHNYHQQQQQQQRLPIQQAGNITSDSYSTTSSGTPVSRKPGSASTTTASSYNYTQYSSEKSIQPSHHDAHQQQPSYSTSFVGGHHSHHLNLSSCINPSPAVSYANVHSTHAAYGQQTATSHQGHYYRQSHQQQQQQHHQLPGMSSSASSAVPVPNSSSTSSSTITNFNLSTICPEINDKTGRSRDGRSAVTSVPGTVAATTGIPSSVPSIIAHW